MAGYSGTPLPKKLGMKECHRVALVNEPADFRTTLGELPPALEFVDLDGRPVDVIVCFVTERGALEAQFKSLARALVGNGGLWIAWPKKASGVATDLSEGVIREIGLAGGLVDNKVCAIDETWSGLRFVYRLADRKPR